MSCCELHWVQTGTLCSCDNENRDRAPSMHVKKNVNSKLSCINRIGIPTNMELRLYDTTPPCVHVFHTRIRMRATIPHTFSHTTHVSAVLSSVPHSQEQCDQPTSRAEPYKQRYCKTKSNGMKVHTRSFLQTRIGGVSPCSFRAPTYGALFMYSLDIPQAAWAAGGWSHAPTQPRSQGGRLWSAAVPAAGSRERREAPPEASFERLTKVARALAAA